PPVEAERAEGIGIGQPLDRAARQPGPQPEVPDRIVALPPRRRQKLRIRPGEPLDLAEAEPDGMAGQYVAAHVGMSGMEAAHRRALSPTAGSLLPLQQTVPGGMID